MAISSNPALKPGQMPSTQRMTMTQPQKKTVPAKESVAPTDAADDVTQQGLQIAQQSLNAEPTDAVDADRVAAMQALIAAGEFTVDTDALADSMLSFFQK
ncbi:flagellar biosynthesis anti-sigma factor FlgM [Enterobacter sp.]|uniref:flagellar biosynthesis anti-sigma factor FlgM n=1 Tax=Enterobacter sp. TaxID=42895 RepID=UPI0029820368|nr:flagellar biosynthesis anti-sigma factor FlgM [Enterobacter sp.]